MNSAWGYIMVHASMVPSEHYWSGIPASLQYLRNPELPKSVFTFPHPWPANTGRPPAILAGRRRGLPFMKPDVECSEAVSTSRSKRAHSGRDLRSMMKDPSMCPAAKSMLESKETAGHPETHSQDSLKLISSQAILFLSISLRANPRKWLGCSQAMVVLRLLCSSEPGF